MSAPKHTPGPIPTRLWVEFATHMQAHDFDELPDGAWFCTLETAAEQFMRDRKIRGDGNDAAHQYLDHQAGEGGSQ